MGVIDKKTKEKEKKKFPRTLAKGAVVGGAVEKVGEARVKTLKGLDPVLDLNVLVVDPDAIGVDAATPGSVKLGTRQLALLKALAEFLYWVGDCNEWVVVLSVCFDCEGGGGCWARARARARHPNMTSPHTGARAARPQPTDLHVPAAREHRVASLPELEEEGAPDVDQHAVDLTATAAAAREGRGHRKGRVGDSWFKHTRKTTPRRIDWVPER